MLGVAVGALTRNTVAAVIGVIVWTRVIEVGILQAAVPSIAKWLPTGAPVAVTGSATPVPGLLAPGIAVTFRRRSWSGEPLRVSGRSRS